jgi:hypothetical protein
LVIQGRFKVHQRVADYTLHLQGVEVPLVGNRVTHGLFDILNLIELDRKHLIEPLEVLLHVIVSHTSTQLVEDGLYSACEVSVHLGDAFLVLLVARGVLLHPVLAV